MSQNQARFCHDYYLLSEMGHIASKEITIPASPAIRGNMAPPAQYQQNTLSKKSPNAGGKTSRGLPPHTISCILSFQYYLGIFYSFRGVPSARPRPTIPRGTST